MKISYSPYTLIPLAPLNAVSTGTSRQGALLKIEEGEGLIGYADLHPWVELGDVSLPEQLECLQAGRSTELIEQSISLAHRDAQLRCQKKSIYDEGEPVRNNFLISDLNLLQPALLSEIKHQGFATVKLKVGRDLVRESEALRVLVSADLKIRLDFNATVRADTVTAFLKSLPEEVLHKIEYIEDPCVFEEQAWRSLQSFAKIAVDNQYDQVPWEKLKSPPFDVIVIKPAKMNVDKAMARCLKWNLHAAVTSYMDHPVGVMHALGVAMELKKRHGSLMLDSGCWTHHLYQENIFSQHMSLQGPFILKVQGTGVGFDELLGALPWHQIKMS